MAEKVYLKYSDREVKEITYEPISPSFQKNYFVDLFSKELQEKPAENLSEKDNPKKLIYIADDDSVREVVAEIISSEIQDYFIELFSDGHSLKEKLEEHLAKKTGLELVITDNGIPPDKSFGLNLIKEYSQKINVPMILMSANYSPEQIEDAKNAGAYGFIPKPSENRYIINLVQQALDSRKQVR